MHEWCHWVKRMDSGRLAYSIRIKDAGIAIRHSQGRILFYTAGPRNGLERKSAAARETKRKRKTLDFFVKEEFIEDVRQDKKHVPVLLEARGPLIL